MGFWSRSRKSRNNSSSLPKRRKWKPTLETLERRDVMTGSWTPLTNLIPDVNGAQTMMLLSDGTVMVMGGSDNASNVWYGLTPDSTGSYVKGTWFQLASSSVQRLFAPMVTLPDGRVMILGGEYSGPNTDPNLNNTGEIYNPVTNKWTGIAKFPQAQFGDDPLEVLPNGQVLAGYIFDGRTYIYNPASNTWKQTGTKVGGDRSDEESWVKLPDDSILSYDVFNSTNTPTSDSSAQRYIPSKNQWVATGNLTNAAGQPLTLTSADVGFELGPAMLLPDGRVIQFGGTGTTAYYTPSTDTWTQGPDIPDSLVATDNPAAVLPNGHVLVAFSPFGSNPDGSFAFPPPTSVYELDPIANTWTQVDPPANFGLDQENAFATTMLVLPTGQVMMTNFTRQLEIYTPDGAPQASWAPTIQSIARAGSTFTLTGTQLTGLNEGAAYGDDWQMASNYPLVRLTSIATGAVSYARTSNWSTTGVQTGNAPVTVNFTLPTGNFSGTYLLQAVANGIASTPRLVVFGTNGGDTITLSATSVTFGPVTSPYTASAISGIDVFAGNGTNSITIQSTPAAPLPINIHGGTGTDQFNIGNAGVISGIVNVVNIDGTSGNDTVTIDDSADTTARIVTIAGTQIGAAAGDNFFAVGGSLALANISNITVQGGTGGNHFNVLSTNSGEAVAVLAGANSDQVFIGSSGSGTGNLKNILGPVAVTGQGGTTAVSVDDSGSTSSNTLTLSATTLTSAANNLFGAGGSLAYSALGALTIKDGSGGNHIQILSSAAGTLTTIQTGTGDDDVVLDSTPGSTPGDVNGILGSLVVNGQAGANTLLVEDRNDSIARHFTITSSLIGGGPGDNLFGSGASLTYASLGSLTLNGGSGGNTIAVQGALPGTFDLNTGTGSDAVTFGTGGPSSTLAGLLAKITIDGGLGTNSVTLDDSGSSKSDIVTLTPTTVGADPGDSFLPAGASFTYANFTNLTVDTSNANPGDTISVFPSDTTTFFINAGNPTTLPGDRLTMNLGGITGATLNLLTLDTGSWTFTNAKDTNFTGIEKQSTLTVLGGLVFQDVNGNGLMDAGDQGIPGQTVTLFDAGDNQVAQQTTSSTGSFAFFVPAGTYHVVEALPAGVLQTTQTPPDQTVVFGSPDVNNLNFGNFTTTALSGTVFNDANGNGTKDAGDTGLQDWKVDLDVNADGTVDQSRLTDANGNYSFSGLLPGTYRIRVEGMTGWLQTTTDPADIVNASGVDHTGLDFGSFHLVTISGQAFDDLVGNGLLDSGDTPLVGWNVDLDTNADGSVDATAITDNNGKYSFPGLMAGTYRIRLEGQTGWVLTNVPADITAVSGQDQLSVNLGAFQKFTIRGEAFLDANASGVKDSGEAGLANWTVYLDANGNGQLDNGEVSTTTDANGNFSFPDLGPGVYKVREVVQAGWAQTTPTPADLTGQTGLDATADFGNFQIITISGQVFNDLDGAGSKQSGDAGLQNWTVFLDTNGNGLFDPGELSTTTDANGNFSFAVPFIGTAKLAEIVPSGWLQTTTQSSIDLHAGLVFSEDIGNFQTISLTSQVFVDSDGNGANTGGTEPGRNGVKVSLYTDVNHNGVYDLGVDTLFATATSAPVGTKDGMFSFSAIPAGAYLLLETAVPGSGQTAPPAPGYYSFTSQSGQNITGKDFGNLAGVAQSFLFVVYQDLFARRIDTPGLTYWTAVLNRGVSRQLVVRQLAGSTEGYAKVVGDLYEEYLHRAVDSQGLAYGIKVLSTEPPPAGFTPQQFLKDQILGSSEYFATRASSNNQTFVATMYHDLTGSDPSSTTASALLAELSTSGRGAVALEVLKGTAGLEFVVQNYYQQILNRQSDSGGLAFFVGNLQHGGREEEIQQVLLGSDEFFAGL
jgi:hypothetical protein